MIIAVHPSRDNRIAAIWSQLECFSMNYDKIVIVSIRNKIIEDKILKLMLEIENKMPEIALKIERKIIINNVRRDTGLWCDYLTLNEKVLISKVDESVRISNETETIDETLITSTIHEYYDNFLLINDSVMAVEHSNELLETKTQGRLINSVSYVGGDQVK